jgi:cell division protein DivIC
VNEKMAYQHGRDNVLFIQRSAKPVKKPESASKSQSVRPLHPAVKRRRLIWLGCMVVFIVWAAAQSVIQQVRIWDQEKELADKQRQLSQAYEQQKTLKQEVQKLKSEDYMMELAHKMGYGKPGEQIYSIENKE